MADDKNVHDDTAMQTVFIFHYLDGNIASKHIGVQIASGHHNRHFIILTKILAGDFAIREYPQRAKQMCYLCNILSLKCHKCLFLF